MRSSDNENMKIFSNIVKDGDITKSIWHDLLNTNISMVWLATHLLSEEDFTKYEKAVTLAASGKISQDSYNWVVYNLLNNEEDYMKEPEKTKITTIRKDNKIIKIAVFPEHIDGNIEKLVEIFDAETLRYLSVSSFHRNKTDITHINFNKDGTSTVESFTNNSLTKREILNEYDKVIKEEIF